MDRSMIVSATVAAALHGLVLFGFGSNATGRTGGPADPKPGRVSPPPLRPDLPDEVIELRPVAPPEDRAAAAEPPAPSPTPPSIPEPPAVAASDARFAIEVPPTRTDVVTHLNVIPARTFDFGVEGGRGTISAGAHIAGSGDLDEPPRTRLQAAPLFPYAARREGLGGEVLVEFVVDEAGRVRDARAVRTTHPVFEDAAVRAVGRWVFEPGRRHGRVVAFRMAVPIVFNVGD